MRVIEPGPDTRTDEQKADDNLFGKWLRSYDIEVVLLILGQRKYNNDLAKEPNHCKYCHDERWFIPNPAEGIWICSSSACYYGVGQIEYTETFKDALERWLENPANKELAESRKSDREAIKI